MPHYLMSGQGAVQQLSPPDSPHMSGPGDKYIEQDWKKPVAQYPDYGSHHASVRTPPSYPSQPDALGPLLSGHEHGNSYGDSRHAYAAGVTPQSQPDASQSSFSSFTPVRHHGGSSQDHRSAGLDASASFGSDVAMNPRTSDDDNDDEDDEGGSEQDAMEGETDRPMTAAEMQRQKRKMKRFRLTHQQTRFLMAEFAKDPHPDATHRERLAGDIPGLSPRQVQVWFQNRRAKLKRMTAEDRERMTSSRALPENFSHPYMYNPGTMQASGLTHVGHGRYNAVQPLTLDTGAHGSGRESAFASPTGMTPAMNSFNLAQSSPSLGDHRAPMSAGAQLTSFGFRSMAGSPALPMVGQGHDGLHSAGLPNMLGHLPTMDHRHRQMSMDSHMAHMGTLPSPWSAVHNEAAHDRRYSVSQTASQGRDAMGMTYSSLDNHRPSTYRSGPASAGPLHTSYSPGSASYPPFFDYAGPSTGSGMYNPTTPAETYGVAMLPPPTTAQYAAVRAERRTDADDGDVSPRGQTSQ